eukprot:CAMPEP_0204531664 /NCGR_PEP_ID=MMETSP0661-20131031/11293_1 /ASSEMBLY_ACC=CAM_ASM_000606 /TAXON_ID=109239 /ORGANISM="Alexandrium margalefi, Strain AMGDE01CS-322" /LENGTH=67 /DNA_ID=CAMNT_0051537833 /DNA_START=1 /DNA_END=204 /DNA_ORIENTATION=+
MRQGVLGVKVKIMLSHDPEGKMGPAKCLPDKVIVREPKEEPVPLARPGQEPEAGGYGGGDAGDYPAA